MKKYFIVITCLLSVLVGFLCYQYFIFNDGKLHIIFCDVGQGDAILIRTPSSKYVLIDAGPDKLVLECLSRHAPLWQRSLDLVLLTHPHVDHFMGFHFVKDRYHIKKFATESITNTTPAFELFEEGFVKKNIPKQVVSAGDSWQMGDGVQISIVGPSQNYIERSSPGGTIGETKEFASLITLVSYGSFKALLTGDSQAAGLEEAIALLEGEVTIVQAPHHGSASGLNASIIEKLSPQTAVISVGKNNYGHPTLATLHLLQDIPIKRTDQEGDVEFVSDGY